MEYVKTRVRVVETFRSYGTLLAIPSRITFIMVGKRNIKDPYRFAHMPAANMPLSPLTQWSQEHIENIFESKSDSEAMLAIAQTFATSLKGSINGKDLTYEGLKLLVQAVRNSSSNRSLKIEWNKIIESPADEHNRVSAIAMQNFTFADI
jgi:hypothetical protein